MNTPKVILITGCSSGFGLLSAVRLAHRGHLVWATMRNVDKKADLENALGKNNSKVMVRGLDVTQPDTIKRVVDEIKQAHSRIDVVINNAGYGVAGFFEDLTQEEIRGVMETNFFGVQNVCREVVPLMRHAQSGKIINISSIAGQTAMPCLGAYNTSKWALEAFSESLYHELSLFGVSVVLVEPGSYPTNIFKSNAHYAKNFDNAQSAYFSFSQKLKAIAESKLKELKRDPDEVARLIEAIVDNPRPRLRYISDFSSWGRVMAQKMMPPRMASQIFRRFMYGN